MLLDTQGPGETGMEYVFYRALEPVAVTLRGQRFPGLSTPCSPADSPPATAQTMEQVAGPMRMLRPGPLKLVFR